MGEERGARVGTHGGRARDERVREVVERDEARALARRVAQRVLVLDDAVLELALLVERARADLDFWCMGDVLAALEDGLDVFIALFGVHEDCAHTYCTQGARS